MNFTKEQIDCARAKVKTGADFPYEIQEFKSIGIIKYEFILENGICIYYGTNDFSLTASSEYNNLGISTLKINTNTSLEKFKVILLEHQHGKSNFATFCKQAADCGVYKWTSDLIKMSCTYYDSKNNALLSEKIPEIE